MSVARSTGRKGRTATLRMAGFGMGTALFLMGCGDAGSASGGDVTVTDSAGVSIVENAGPIWGEGGGWSVSSEPSVRIGVAQGDPEYQLFGVRDATTFSDGRILVLNGGSEEIRVFTPDGVYTSTIGQQGEGPGEFQNLLWFFVTAADSIAAYDSRATRLSIIAPDGAFVRSEAVEPFVSMERWLPDGSLVVFGGPPFSFDNVPPDGFNRSETSWRRVAPGGDGIDTVTTQPAQANLVESIEGGVSFGRIPFDTWPLVRFSDAGYAVAVRSEYRIDLHTLDGTWTHSIRRPVPNRSVTEEDVEQWVQVRLANVDPSRHAQIRSNLEEFPIAETFPAHAEFGFDALGYLWVQGIHGLSEPPAGTETGNPWSVFDPEGRWLGDVMLPVGLELYEIGADYLLGKVEDDFEVEYVVKYDLTRN